MEKPLARLITIFCLMTLGLVNFNAHAIEVEGLYQVEVPVADQTAKTRWGAVLEGFKEVLIRKSGSRQVISAEESRQAFRKVTAYLQRFQYIPNTDENIQAPFLLKLDFEPRLVDELIQEAGMPIWGSDRPVTILWLAAEENFSRQILKDDAENSISALLKSNAKRRGIPIIFPLMDLEDELNVNISDVWGRFNNTVVNASGRYGADSVVTGRLAKIGEVWQVKLSYINQGDEQFLEFDVDSPELLSETLADHVAELLCQKYCVVETLTSHQISVQVSGINNFASFKKVQDYLQGLSSIRKIEVDKISATTVRFGATLLGDLQSVKDGIELGKKLIVETEPSIDPFAKPVAEIDDNFSLEENNELQPEGSSLPTEVGEISADNNNDLTNALGSSELLNDLDGSPVSDDLQSVVLYYRWVE